MQSLTGIPMTQQRLVFRGSLVLDHKTPADYNCDNETCMHLVRFMVRNKPHTRPPIAPSHRPHRYFCCQATADLNEVITEAKLKGNCMYCHKAGAQFAVRPLCGPCVYVAVDVPMCAGCGRASVTNTKHTHC